MTNSVEPEVRVGAARSIHSLSGRMRWSVVLLILYLAVIFTIQPAFFSTANLSALVYYTCLVMPAVLGVHVLIVLGQFDLSVGATAAMAGVIAAKGMTHGFPIGISILLAVSAAVSFGALNWLLVVQLRISALIATFITLGVASAVSLAITEGVSISGLPTSFSRITAGSSLRSPAIIFGVGLVCVLEILTQRHVLFRRLYQVGSNTAAARSSGINVKAVQLFGFALASAGAAVTGVLQSSRTLSASPFVFNDLALECIAACVIGGARLSGGTGRAAGAFFGMLMVVISRNLVVMAGVNIYWQDLGVSLVLLAAVLLRGREEYNSGGASMP
jgi:ribose transport system permease protein